MSEFKEYDEGFTQVPHTILNALIERDFSKRQYQVLNMIIRLALGCHPNSTICFVKDNNDFASWTGLSKANVSRTLKELKDMRIITQVDSTFMICPVEYWNIEVRSNDQ